MEKKLLIKSSSIDLVNRYISDLDKGRKVEWCESIDIFFQTLMQVDLFKKQTNKIVVLNRLSEDYLKDLRSVLENYDFEDILVLIEREEDSFSGKDYEVIKKICKFIKLNEPDKDYCIRYITYFFTKNSIKYEKDLPFYIFSIVGKDFLRLENELNKILDYYKGGFDGIVDKDIVNSICLVDKEVEIYRLVEMLFKKKINDFFYNFKTKDYSFQLGFIQYLISVLKKLYDIIMYKRYPLSTLKTTNKDISEYLGISVFLLEKIMVYLIYFNQEKILFLLELLNKLDIELRSTDLRRDLIIESYLLKVFKL